jgi:hypothetical protein
MENANVHLSAAEQELVQDANVILTKNAVVEKVKALLAGVSNQAVAVFGAESRFAFNRPLLPPRLTRGENYLGLPWVAMDYPRIFEKDGISSVRSIFWWGHHFSCTWHCSGIYKEWVQDAVLRNIQYLAKGQWLVYTGSDEWAHELSGAHHKVADKTEHDFEQLLKQPHFFKLCKYLPLSQWKDTAAFYDTCFEELIKLPF